jgi:RimJ/RimL family protein N-acetyltransferase
MPSTMLDPSQALGRRGAAQYEMAEELRDGRRFKIRAIRPDDKDTLLAAVGRSSAQSVYRRFFSPKRGFTEQEIAYFVNVDFINHVALVATLEDEGRMIIGGCRYIVVQPGKAEMAFFVDDQYQGQGVGAALMRHLAKIARDAGLKELIAEILADNISMLKVFQKSGLRLSTSREGQVIHVALQLV